MPSIHQGTKPLGPFKLVTVNTAPERAKRLIGRLVEALKEKYTILYVANVEGNKEVSRNYQALRETPH